jgi:hypothetical protein
MNSDIIRISFDLETMSLENNAAIVQLAACVICEDSSPNFDAFNIYISPKSSEKAGLHVDKSTMEWWSKQDEAVRQRVFSGTDSIAEALDSFQEWVSNLCGGNYERIRFYSNGWKDHAWLESAYYAVFGKYPFHYRSPQDLRTLRDVTKYAGLVVPEFPNAAKHNALSDAICQAQEIDWILTELAKV